LVLIVSQKQIKNPGVGSGAGSKNQTPVWFGTGTGTGTSNPPKPGTCPTLINMSFRFFLSFTLEFCVIENPKVGSFSKCGVSKDDKSGPSFIGLT
jgi:hypothetical protein